MSGTDDTVAPPPAAPPAAPSSAASALDDAWVIFGASSGVGRAFARVAAAAGKPLVLAGRDAEDLALDGRDLVLRGSPAVRTVTFDGTQTDGFAGLAGLLDAALPGPFNVMLAHAVLYRQEVCEADPALARAVFDVNAGSTAALMLQLAPLMEARKGGRLVVIGSVAGDRVRRRNAVYGASKLALHGFTVALRARLMRSGVSVMLVKPGPLDTAMTYGRDMPAPMSSAGDCAAAIWHAAGRGRQTVYFPPVWRWIMLVLRLLPETIFRRLDV